MAMGVISCGTGGEGGVGEDKITYFNIAFLLDLSGIHILTLYPYSDILRI